MDVQRSPGLLLSESAVISGQRASAHMNVYIHVRYPCGRHGVSGAAKVVFNVLYHRVNEGRERDTKAERASLGLPQERGIETACTTIHPPSFTMIFTPRSITSYVSRLSKENLALPR